MKGRLLVMCGEVDENAFPAATIRFVEACIREGKDVEMFNWPGADHTYRNTAYYRQKVRNFFAGAFGIDGH
jgi:dipeptidyl aminopeptidase/acylaminoacyl peptidase